MPRCHPTLYSITDRKPLTESYQTRGDHWRFHLNLTAPELTDAQLIFTAKSDLNLSDDQAEIHLRSDTAPVANGSQIVVDSNQGNFLTAKLDVSPEDTLKVDFCDEQLTIKNAGRLMYPLFFDLQLMRAGTPATSPKIQTFYFPTPQKSRFWVVQDVTMTTI